MVDDQKSVDSKKGALEVVVVPKLPEAGENKVRFLVWFTEALTRFQGVKAHHLHSVQAFFTSLGLMASETIEAYDEGLKKFGYGQVKRGRE